MLLMQEQHNVIGEYLTLRQAAEAKGASYDALRMWVRNHEVPTRRLATFHLVRLVDLESYVPMRVRSKQR